MNPLRYEVPQYCVECYNGLLSDMRDLFLIRTYETLSRTYEMEKDQGPKLPKGVKGKGPKASRIKGPRAHWSKAPSAKRA